MRRLILSLTVLLLCCGVAAAQMRIQPSVTKSVATKTTDKPAPAPVKKKAPKPKTLPAQELFGSVLSPAPLAARSIGSYSKGCLAGGVSLPINGPDWQVMRLSRNRNWGAPQLVDFLERFASDARAFDDWPGLLVGDMSQPRGGPMLTGHTSHQVGLDADIWLTPMPERTLTRADRENMTAASMLQDPLTVDPKKFTILQVKLIKRAASYPQVARIFVHPAIKKALCDMADQVGKDRSWLSKVRPWWNHYYHFHIRLSCPPGMDGCVNQAPVGSEDGCDGKELDNWFALLKKSAIWQAQQATSSDSESAPRKRKETPLNNLPSDCRSVLTAGGNELMSSDDELPPEAVAAMDAKEAGPPLPVLTKAQLDMLLAGGDLEIPRPDRNPKR